MPSKRNGSPIAGVVVIFLILLVLFAPIGYCSALKSSSRLITVQVDDRERQDSAGRYLVFAPDTEYQVDDSIIFWKWDASSRYNKLDPGKEYRVRVAGWRVHFLSMYPNIIEVYGEDTTQ